MCLIDSLERWTFCDDGFSQIATALPQTTLIAIHPIHCLYVVPVSLQLSRAVSCLSGNTQTHRERCLADEKGENAEERTAAHERKQTTAVQLHWLLCYTINGDTNLSRHTGNALSSCPDPPALRWLRRPNHAAHCGIPSGTVSGMLKLL